MYSFLFSFTLLNDIKQKDYSILQKYSNSSLYPTFQCSYRHGFTSAFIITHQLVKGFKFTTTISDVIKLRGDDQS